MKNYLIGFFLILSVIILYLILFSQSSLFSFFNLRKEFKENKNILNTLQKESEDLQGKIKKLKNNDLEYLDHLARDKHEMSKPNEIIIFNNK